MSSHKNQNFLSSRGSVTPLFANREWLKNFHDRKEAKVCVLPSYNSTTAVLPNILWSFNMYLIFSYIFSTFSRNICKCFVLFKVENIKFLVTFFCLQYISKCNFIKAFCLVVNEARKYHIIHITGYLIAKWFFTP